MTTEQIITLTISGLSLGISILSVFYNLRRDSKRVLFSIYRGSIYSLSPQGEIIGSPLESTQIDLVNYGFVPASISSIGGDYRDSFCEKLKRIFNPDKNQRTRFVFSQPALNAQLRNKDGSNRLLNPGEKISITLPDLNGDKESKAPIEKQKKLIDDIVSLYAWDVDGTKHKASKKVLKKYKKDMMEFLNKK